MIPLKAQSHHTLGRRSDSEFSIESFNGTQLICVLCVVVLESCIVADSERREPLVAPDGETL